MSETQEEFQAQVEQGVEDYEDKEAHERSYEKIDDKEEAKEVAREKREEVNKSLDDTRDEISDLKEEKEKLNKKLESGELSGEETAEISDRFDEIEDRLKELSQERAKLAQKANEVEKTLARLEGGKKIEESGYLERLWKGKEHVVGEFESAEARQESFEAALELADDWKTAEGGENVIKIKTEHTEEQDQKIESTIEVESEGLDGGEIISGNPEIIKKLETDDVSVGSEDIKRAVEESLNQTAEERMECREDIKILQKEISQKSEEISESENPKEEGLLKDLKKLSSALERRERQLDILTEYQKQQEEALSDAERQDQDLVGEALPSNIDRITQKDESEEMQPRDFSQAKEVLMDFNTGEDSDDFESALSRAERKFGESNEDSSESTSESGSKSSSDESSEATTSEESSEDKSSESDADESEESRQDQTESDSSTDEESGAGTEDVDEADTPEDGDSVTEDGGENVEKLEESLKELEGEIEEKQKELQEQQGEVENQVGEIFDEAPGTFFDDFKLVDIANFVAEGGSLDDISNIEGVDRSKKDLSGDIKNRLEAIQDLVSKEEEYQEELEKLQDEKVDLEERLSSISDETQEQQDDSSVEAAMTRLDDTEISNTLEDISENETLRFDGGDGEGVISEIILESEKDEDRLEETEELQEELEEKRRELAEFIEDSEVGRGIEIFVEATESELKKQIAVIDSIIEIQEVLEDTQGASEFKVEDDEIEVPDDVYGSDDLEDALESIKDDAPEVYDGLKEEIKIK